MSNAPARFVQEFRVRGTVQVDIAGPEFDALISIYPEGD
jgi:hypothetical protein